MAKYDKNTLIIKHLPHELTVKDRIDLLKHLGANDVRCIVSEVKKTSLTFAHFKSEVRCLSVLKSLHQKEILGSLISVEFARPGRRGEDEDGCHVEDQSTDVTSQRKIVDAYLKKINSWTSSLDFSQPPPPNIRYSYPPPTPQVLMNICRVLAKVPKFYTQVLHLMNKMNLPCPFSDKFTVCSDLVSHDFVETALTAEEAKAQSSTEEESEIDSEPEQTNEPTVAVRKPLKRPKKGALKVLKIARRNKVGENRQVLKAEEVFEASQVRSTKKIELRVSADLSVPTETQKLPEKAEGFELMEPALPQTDQSEGVSEKVDDQKVSTGVISAEELEMNRILPKDFHLLPVFKNYQAGPPTCRLYIKNLAKTVTPTDLEFIFGRYRVEESGDQVNLYDIRLMQEGRMKGQAFVTLQSVELAEKAVSEVNGYILKGKAMVIQFARSNKPK